MQDHPDRRAFSGAVGAEKSEDVAPSDLDVQMIHSQSVFIALRQRDGTQHGVGHNTGDPSIRLQIRRFFALIPLDCSLSMMFI
jgi:hypothetical protein